VTDDTSSTAQDSVTGADRIVAGFARALRAAGVAVPTGSVVLFAEALGLVGLDDPDRVYWAGRATLVHRAEEIALYDRVFASYWQDHPLPRTELAAPEPTVRIALDDDEVADEAASEGEPGDTSRALRYSAVEVLKQRDLAALTPAEWVEAERLISALSASSDSRPSRRSKPSKRRSAGPPDLRGTVRRSIPNGGVPLRRAWREPVERMRRLVFLIDVSGSMEPYARALLRFAHAAVTSRRHGQAEVFTIGTRLTRVTRELAARDPDSALSGAALAVSDWSGGTRIGPSMREFNDLWGVRGMARGAVVVVFSDGWDRGDPDLLASEMARLSRVARRVVWANPLKASPGYAPLARGMAAALPFVDQFVEGHSVSSLEHLAAVIAGTANREMAA
jgi:uncharacterized protein